MIRIALILGAGCVALGSLLLLERSRHASTRDALTTALEYIDTREETDDALSDLPDDPDAALDRLCDLFPGGSGCSDP